MPSETHQNFVFLFQSHPELSFELVARAGAPVRDRYERHEQVSAEVEDPLNPENPIRADLALAGHKQGKARRVIVIEVQLGEDLGKEWTTVLYRAGLRRRHECPAWTVWFSPDPDVRASVQEKMFIEEPELRPLVVTPEMIPPVHSLEAALADYAWAVLAAAMHATGPNAVSSAMYAIQAVLRIAPEDDYRYIQSEPGRFASGPLARATLRAVRI